MITAEFPMMVKNFPMITAEFPMIFTKSKDKQAKRV